MHQLEQKIKTNLIYRVPELSFFGTAPDIFFPASGPESSVVEPFHFDPAQGLFYSHKCMSALLCSSSRYLTKRDRII